MVIHLNAGERRRAAIEASVTAATRCGLSGLRPVILKDSNNTLVHLEPHPVVAKVATSPLAGQVGDGLERERRVLEFLARSQAPAVRLSGLLPAGPHQAAGLLLIFLDYATAVRDVAGPIARARVLDQVHEALARFPDRLPGYLEPFTAIAAVLADEAATPTLRPDDRSFLLRAHAELVNQAPAPRPGWQALHGDPSVGNMIVTADGPLLLDFEAACHGPLEWDWSPLPANVVERSRAVLDPGLLRLCRRLFSLSVSAWCWSQPRRAPEVDEAATWHLGALRQGLA